jgi:hypothetical protein
MAVAVPAMVDNLWKRVDLACRQRLGLGDQVLIASRIRSGNQIDAKRRRCCAEVGRRELVDDCGDVRCGVLRGLTVLGSLGGDEDFYGDGHVSSLESSDNHITQGQPGRNECDRC